MADVSMGRLIWSHLHLREKKLKSISITVRFPQVCLFMYLITAHFHIVFLFLFLFPQVCLFMYLITAHFAPWEILEVQQSLEVDINENANFFMESTGIAGHKQLRVGRKFLHRKQGNCGS
jgi:hypothetical protein